MPRYWINDQIVNTAKARARWEDATYQETLYYSSEGRYYLAQPGPLDDPHPHVRWLTTAQAMAWLVRYGVTLPEGQDSRHA
jgi:hypothetical protein